MSLQCFIILFCVCVRGIVGQSTDNYIERSTLEDELYFTTNSTEMETRNMTSSCSDGEWQCKKDGDCISNNLLCDGLIDCEDASDEYRDLCKHNTRPLFGLLLHCSSFWSDYHKDLCHQICKNSTEFCYYALLADNNEEDQAICVLPEFPVNGWYQIRPENTTSDPKAPKDFWLDYQCEEPYVIIEKTRHECNNGSWLNDDDHRYCSEACKLIKNENFTYSCPLNINNSNNCNNYVAINTNVTVSRVLHTVEEDKALLKNVTVELSCSPDKEFYISTDCVDEVDRRQQEFENPTMGNMTTYEREFNKFQANETSNEFRTLVDRFHEFEKKVRNELKEMQIMAERCDISLDLLLWHLQNKKNAESQKDEEDRLKNMEEEVLIPE